MADGVSVAPPAAPSLITDRRGHWQGDQYVSPAGSDTWNEYQMAKYNNEYNYWLLQQQQAYNDPAAQVERLRNAGLNPNFNSIEGSGNTNYSMAASTRGLSSNVGTLGNQQLGLMLNAFNSVISGISQGISSAKTLSGIPSDVRQARKDASAYFSALRGSAEWKSMSDQQKYYIDRMEASYLAYLSGQNIGAPSDGWVPQNKGPYLAGEFGNTTELTPYQPNVTREEGSGFIFSKTPRAQMYGANLDRAQAAAAAEEANKVLAQWRSSQKVTDKQYEILERQFDILGVEKELKEWLRDHRDSMFAYQVASGIVSLALRAL